jgi:hypothetical protein
VSGPYDEQRPGHPPRHDSLDAWRRRYAPARRTHLPQTISRGHAEIPDAGVMGA